MGMVGAPIVRDTLSHGVPVVALECTIISHGMPYLQNLEIAKRVELHKPQHLDGVLHIGLNHEELKLLASLGKKAQRQRLWIFHMFKWVFSLQNFGAGDYGNSWIIILSQCGRERRGRSSFTSGLWVLLSPQDVRERRTRRERNDCLEHFYGV
ncbi:hypothetical protein AMTRI_Chr03g44240 [Amborella trichopoda]